MRFVAAEGGFFACPFPFPLPPAIMTLCAVWFLKYSLQSTTLEISFRYYYDLELSDVYWVAKEK
jgi:hypothetical protein